jgi:ribosomal protein S24E
MPKFVIVKEAPKDLKKGEYLIDKPFFKEEIELHKPKTPRNGLTGSHHLRALLGSIAENYDPENMTAFSAKVHNYEGVKFSSDSELNDILVRMLKADYPTIFTKYLDKKIKIRPAKTELIYYVDSKIPFMYEQFYKYGFNNDVEKEETKNSKKAKNDDSN